MDGWGNAVMRRLRWMLSLDSSRFTRDNEEASGGERWKNPARYSRRLSLLSLFSRSRSSLQVSDRRRR
jgi:hypothetical protein